MTDEVGAITGELELLTRVTPDGTVEAMVRYAGAQDLYTVSGSPVRAVSEHPDQGEHHIARSCSHRMSATVPSQTGRLTLGQVTCA